MREPGRKDTKWPCVLSWNVYDSGNFRCWVYAGWSMAKQLEWIVQVCSMGTLPVMSAARNRRFLISLAAVDPVEKGKFRPQALALDIKHLFWHRDAKSQETNVSLELKKSVLLSSSLQWSLGMHGSAKGFLVSDVQFQDTFIEVGGTKGMSCNKEEFSSS